MAFKKMHWNANTGGKFPFTDALKTHQVESLDYSHMEEVTYESAELIQNISQPHFLTTYVCSSHTRRLRDPSGSHITSYYCENSSRSYLSIT